MVSQTVRISDEIAQRLERLARVTKCSKTSFIVEALERYIEEAYSKTLTARELLSNKGLACNLEIPSRYLAIKVSVCDSDEIQLRS